LHDDALHFARGHYRQRPEVSLTGALEIAFVIEFLDGGLDPLPSLRRSTLLQRGAIDLVVAT
jgi:hypothetical protein